MAIPIDEAIKGISEVKKLDCHVKYPEWQGALQLGIEALKAWKEHRGICNLIYPLLLPGETEE
jgi:hypothetical protein